MVWVMLSQVDIAHEIGTNDHLVVVQLLGKLQNDGHDYRRTIRNKQKLVSETLQDSAILPGCFERTAAAASRYRYSSSRTVK